MSVVTLRPTQSVYVSYGAPNNNYNGNDKLRVGVQSSSGTRYMSLIQFDLSEIPPMALINWAILEIYSYEDDSWRAAIPILVQRCTSSWSAASVTYSTRPSVTTSGQASATHGEYNVWYDYNVKNIVQAWANGSANYGVWLIQDGTTTQRGKAFIRSGDNRPKLTIDYTPIGCRVKHGGQWKQGMVYAKSGGVWRLGQVYAKSGGAWRLGT